MIAAIQSPWIPLSPFKVLVLKTSLLHRQQNSCICLQYFCVYQVQRPFLSPVPSPKGRLKEERGDAAPNKIAALGAGHQQKKLHSTAWRAGSFWSPQRSSVGVVWLRWRRRWWERLIWIQPDGAGGGAEPLEPFAVTASSSRAQHPTRPTIPLSKSPADSTSAICPLQTKGNA